MSEKDTHIGRPTRRVDGRLKVTGQAKYAAERAAPGLLHGYIVSSTIAVGHAVAIHTEVALAFPGVVAVFTHENRRRAAWLDRRWRDDTAPPGHPFRPLHSNRILFHGQPLALVVAESYEAARDAAALVRVDYASEAPTTDLAQARAASYTPPEKRTGIKPLPKPRGDAEAAFASAPVKVREEYRLHAEVHNPMEMFASTCIWEGEGKLMIHDKTQGSQNSRDYVSSVFSIKPADVRVINHHVGGAFGSGLRPQHQLFCAVMASLELERSVRVSLTREQMFHIGHRPDTFQTVALAADSTGVLQAVMHDAVGSTSRFEDYQEVVVNWGGMLYHCENTRFSYELAQVDTCTPCDMRAPGAASGMAALECAMDELSYAVGIDPLALRRVNFSVKDENEDKQFTSKALEACYQEGAAAFGWERRSAAPRSMREGTELVGWGMATGVWEAMLMPTVATAKLSADGRVEVATASTDIGTGTWTILTQIAAHAFGLPLADVTARIGDSSLPFAPVAGGSWVAASAGAAVNAACEAVQKKLLLLAKRLPGSAFAGVPFEDVEVADRRLRLKGDRDVSLTVAEILQFARLTEIEEEGRAMPDPVQMQRYVSYTHSAVFAEVRVDEELGVVRVTRLVCATAAGKILNPKTARSQILGGLVMGMGMALHEEILTDHGLGKVMNANLGEYHIPANADVGDIEVLFVDEPDDKVSPLGVKGLGEIGVVGTAAAIANAIFHATGKRVRELPITIDKLLEAESRPQPT